ncbi:FadR family transcriptional regulator [bacterium AH-315-I18]|nr:FadR family transcriptional regulator [Phycisphaeraceae bacterium]MBN4061066.1 FadR family transcriptional regulator [bacterium AH-315-I18]
MSLPSSPPAGQFARVQAAPNLVEQVVDSIRQQILDGTFAPGDMLPSEGTFTKQFGVSRTVIREAMHQLRFADLVEVSHGRRPRVKQPSPDASLVSLVTWMRRSDVAIHQLLEVRRPIECEIAGLVAKAPDELDIAKLQVAIDTLRTARTMENRMQADAEFHRLLATGTGNPIFTLFMNALAELLDQQRSRTLKGDRGQRAADDHQIILDCIVKGDVLAARKAMSDHLVWPRT